MRKKIIKKVSSVVLGLTICTSFATVSSAKSNVEGEEGGIELTELTNSEVTPFSTSKQVGGGTWTYDSYKHGWLNRYKTVWSDYWHPNLTHGSSAQLGARTPDRDCVGPDLVSHASQTEKTDDTAYVYWNTSCTR